MKRYRTAIYVLIAGTLFFPAFLYALSETEESALSMYFNKEEMALSPTRYLKPVSQSAENIVVITAEEIKNLNAHTIQDVLKYVTGTFVEIDPGGNGGTLHIQGSSTMHTKVMIDGITLNDLSLNIITLNTIPVQNIERIEIIKGPASSAWGSSLGGLVNIITKDAGGTKPADVTASTSFGAYSTFDNRIEARGTINNFGYYMSAVKYISDGYSRNLPVDMEWFYGKLKFDVTNDFKIGVAGSYSKDRGEPVKPSMDSDNHRAYFVLNADYRINSETSLNGSFRVMEFKNDVYMDTGSFVVDAATLDKDVGGSVIFRSDKSINNLVVGADYDSLVLVSEDMEGGRKNFTRYAAFANDTIVLDKFAVTPGLRYDYYNVSGFFFSPSLGVTYEASKDTVLRLRVARGFNAPSARDSSVSIQSGNILFIPNRSLKVEKVMSYQAGIETALLKYLWVKNTFFLHDIWDSITTAAVQTNVMQAINKAHVIRKGFEFELAAIPIYNTTLSTGFTLVDARDSDTGQRVTDTPRYSIDLGVEYNDKRTFNASIKGHYLSWYTNLYDNSYTFTGDNSFIWDISATKQVYKDERIKAALFLKGANLLNNSLYGYANRLYNGRLMEIGLRAEF
ncbi:MAG: TonB-dependent receptor [Candidatus Magnetominusculus sp. LBB02]|nr:TonB-dependent receptor [Candidatus Magnetominusculus sp. LBB02]